jgi:hypothetical protein
MRSSRKSKRKQTANPGTGVGHRGGVLLPPQQRPEAVSAPAEFLLAFTRALIRNNPQPDLLQLAMASARQEIPITPAQEESFIRAVADEASQSVWPKGFF